jgi:hypothetical protein
VRQIANVNVHRVFLISRIRNQSCEKTPDGMACLFLTVLLIAFRDAMMQNRVFHAKYP